MKKLLLPLVMMILASCSHAPKPQEAPVKPALVLIHGSHFDGASWDLVKEKLGTEYQIVTPNLLGRSENEHPALLTMAQDVCAKIPAKAVLVGHSFGGAVINQMVGVCPEKIVRIVYLTALVPLNGEKPFEALSKVDEKTYALAVKFGKDRITPREPKKFYKAMDAGVDLKKIPTLKLYSESMAAGAESVKYDEAVFAKIPKFYIMATQDQIVTLASQRKYIERTDMAKTGEIASGHLPGLSHPQEVATAILQSFQ